VLGGPADTSLPPASTDGCAEGNRREFSTETFSLIRKVIRMENFAHGEMAAISRH